MFGLSENRALPQVFLAARLDWSQGLFSQILRADASNRFKKPGNPPLSGFALLFVIANPELPDEDSPTLQEFPS